MLQALKRFLNERTQREKVLLGLMAALGVIAIVYYGYQFVFSGSGNNASAPEAPATAAATGGNSGVSSTSTAPSGAPGQASSPPMVRPVQDNSGAVASVSATPDEAGALVFPAPQESGYSGRFLGVRSLQAFHRAAQDVLSQVEGGFMVLPPSERSRLFQNLASSLGVSILQAQFDPLHHAYKLKLSGSNAALVKFTDLSVKSGLYLSLFFLKDQGANLIFLESPA